MGQLADQVHAARANRGTARIAPLETAPGRIRFATGQVAIAYGH